MGGQLLSGANQASTGPEEENPGVDCFESAACRLVAITVPLPLSISELWFRQTGRYDRAASGAGAVLDDEPAGPDAVAGVKDGGTRYPLPVQLGAILAAQIAKDAFDLTRSMTKCCRERP